MARKTRRKPKKPARKTVAKPLAKARKGKAARVKDLKQRVKADTRAAAGAIPQWTPAEVEEAFRRFQDRKSVV